MAQILLGDLTFQIPGSPVTTQTFGVTNGLEYRGDNAPRVYAPRVIEFINLQRDAVADGKTFGSTQAGGGVLRLANPDGYYDDWIDYGVGGPAVFRLVTSTTADFNTATPLVTVKIRRVEMDFDEVRVHLQDRSAETDVAFQSDLYLGTNSGASGVEGLPDDLQGLPRPDALGYVFQAPLPWANQQALILELDSERINNIDDAKVYDGLVGLTRATARASLAALQSASPSSGTFDYYLGGSEDGAYIKLGAVPEYNITADIEGKAPLGVFLNMPGELFDWALQQRAGVDYANISADDLDVLLTSAPYDLGIWIDRQTTVRTVLDRIAASLPGYWYVDAYGVYRLKQARDPGGETPVLTFKVIRPTGIAATSDGDVVSIERLSTNDAGGGVPAWQIRVLYKEFSQVTDLGFDTASNVSIRSEAKSRFRTAVAEDAAIKTLHPLAVTLEFETALVNEADAQAVADALLALYGVRRDRFKIGVRLTPALIASVDLGSYIGLEFPRYGMDSGKTFEVRSIHYRGAAVGAVSEIVDLDIWG